MKVCETSNVCVATSMHLDYDMLVQKMLNVSREGSIDTFDGSTELLLKSLTITQLEKIDFPFLNRIWVGNKTNVLKVFYDKDRDGKARFAMFTGQEEKERACEIDGNE